MFFKRKIIPVKRLSLYLIVFNIVIKNKGQIAKFFIDSWSSIIYSTNPWIPFQEPPLGETVYFCYLSRRGRQANAQCKQDSGLFNLLKRSREHRRRRSEHSSLPRTHSSAPQFQSPSVHGHPKTSKRKIPPRVVPSRGGRGRRSVWRRREGDRFHITVSAVPCYDCSLSLLGGVVHLFLCLICQ